MFYLVTLSSYLLIAFSLLFLWLSFSSLRRGMRKDYFLNTVDKGADVCYVNVLSWNISFAYGFGSDGTDFNQKDLDYYKKNLDSMIEQIKSCSADIVFIQEIDFKAKRSAYFDQLKYLASELNMNYANAVSWDINYVPFPYWPYKDHFGRVKSGGAILSKFPIKSNNVFLHRKPKEYSKMYNAFYLFRYTQRVQIEINNNTIHLYNNHLDAFNTFTRSEQTRQLAKMIKNDNSDYVIAAGDFNATPDYASEKSGFSVSSGQNYENDESHSIMQSIDGFKELLTEKEYRDNERSWFTFPSSSPNRRLDYIYYSKKFENIEKRVMPDKSSDHLAIFGRFKINCS